MSFKLWLESEIDLSFKWITPDDIYNTWSDTPPYYTSGGFTFIYGKVPRDRWEKGIKYPEANQLYTSSRQHTHGYIRRELEHHNSKPSWRYSAWNYLDGLMGRSATIKLSGQEFYLVTVWDGFSYLRYSCIEALREKVGDLHIPWVLSTSGGNQLIGDSKWHGYVTSPEEASTLRQLHLMKSPEKLAARKKLGLFSMKKRPDAEDRILQPEHRDEF